MDANQLHPSVATVRYAPPTQLGFSADSGRCTMIAADINGFGSRIRDDDVQMFIRSALYRILEDSFNESGIGWERCYREDRGDGVLIVTPPWVDTCALMPSLADRLYAGLRFHNKMANREAKIRLRVAAHAGELHFDGNGVVGQAIIQLFRLLEAPTFKQAFADNSADLGFLISDQLRIAASWHLGGLIDPVMVGWLDVGLKDAHTRAWAYFSAPRGRHRV